MVFIVQIIFTCLLIIGAVNALIIDYKKQTEEQKKQPIRLVLESFPVIGLALLMIGVIIFDNLLVGNIAIVIFIIGIVFYSIRHGKSNSVKRVIRAIGLAMCIVIIYGYFLLLIGELDIKHRLPMKQSN